MAFLNSLSPSSRSLSKMLIHRKIMKIYVIDTFSKSAPGTLRWHSNHSNGGRSVDRARRSSRYTCYVRGMNRLSEHRDSITIRYFPTLPKFGQTSGDNFSGYIMQLTSASPCRFTFVGKAFQPSLLIPLFTS